MTQGLPETIPTSAGLKPGPAAHTLGRAGVLRHDADRGDAKIGCAGIG